jgi:hypothetical protein
MVRRWGRMVTDRCRWTERARWTKLDGRWTKRQWTSNEMATNIRQNDDEHQTEWKTATTMQSDPRPQALQRWHAEEKREMFFFYFMFFFFNYSIFFSSSRVATRATHYMTTSSNTHKSAQPRS